MIKIQYYKQEIIYNFLTSHKKMTRVYFTTYEGFVCAYELDPQDDSLHFNQIVNSQESSTPIRSILQMKGLMYTAQQAFVSKYSIETHKLLK